MEKGLTTRESERDLTNWDPFRDGGTIPSLTGLIDELFSPVRLPSMIPKGWMPRVDIHETEKEYALSVALPGVRKEDVRVDVRDGILAIIGERKSEKEEKGKTWLRRETSYGSFERRFVLPDGTHPEDIRAVHKDGVLTVSMPKLAGSKPKGVRVSVE